MVTAPVTVSLGLPEDAKVSVALVLLDVPPNCKLAQTALVIFTVTEPFDAMVTASELVGKVLLFQLLASPQLFVFAPRSQVFCPKALPTKNKLMIINSVAVFLKL